MKLASFGGAAGVTGSKHLLESAGQRLLVDCGMFQGEKAGRLRNWEPPPFDPRTIDAVLLTHGHLDHCGYLPRLVRAGFRGPVYTTRPGREVARVILMDSARLQEEDADAANRDGWSRHRPALPLYDSADVERALHQFRSVAYGRAIRIGSVQATFHYAGHILGAAGVEVDDGRQRVWFSGDLGRPDDPVMYPPRPPTAVDAVVMESTYGDRRHPAADPLDTLASLLERVIERRSVLLVPSFALGRAQTLIVLIDRLLRRRPELELPIYLSSPMAAEVSELYRNYPDEHRLTSADLDTAFGRVRIVEHAQRARRLDKREGPIMIIAGSGMLTGGRILGHLLAHGGEPDNHVLLTGYQAPGTRGRALLDGERELKMHGRHMRVRAQVDVLEGLSAHADCDELQQWLAAAASVPRQVWLVHGEAAARAALAEALRRDRGPEGGVDELPEGVSVDLVPERGGAP
ncbi:MBL fold metallo-hydrolase [Thioalkalivibrio paradoxus]|uniref:Beta-Casp domain-containing protein n=1 Tax=Thioalkalivibrio paradoxus ARh 1 TaxID=713585 RepID=W0DM40_9GAMM|nr:MBL fold metallo-hydrolase [Thioalkalivibrio paradoxus]AHE97950.1 beta-Casp domain-containing protein [Thioalkalivibrio paradoxus ARh 1]